MGRWRRLWHEETGDVVVDHVALWTDGEVRGDQALSAGEPSVAAGDLPDDGASLESGVRARAEDAPPEGPERDPARVGVRDAAGLDERALADDLDLGLEARRLAAARRLDAPVNPVGLQQAPKRLADGRSSRVSFLSEPATGAAVPLNSRAKTSSFMVSSRRDDGLGMSTGAAAGF